MNINELIDQIIDTQTETLDWLSKSLKTPPPLDYFDYFVPRFQRVGELIVTLKQRVASHPSEVTAHFKVGLAIVAKQNALIGSYHSELARWASRIIAQHN